jgi:hypothetical protein
MVYRNGELSKAMMDRDWPHQVALSAYRCLGHNYLTIRLFCEPLSLCPPPQSFRRDDQDMVGFCFAERAHAEQFQARFGGDLHDPKDRAEVVGIKPQRSCAEATVRSQIIRWQRTS